MTTTNTSIISGLPEGLQILHGVACWVGQEYVQNGDKVDKTPKGRSGRDTGPNRPQDLGTYDEIAEMCKRHNYTGMAIHTGLRVKENLDLVVQAIDLDNVRNPETGEITPQAAEIVQDFNTYTEISISGTGLHLFYLAESDANMKAIRKAPNALGKGSVLEIFTAAHFCGVTGDIYSDYKTIGFRNIESKNLYLQYFEYGETPQKQPETATKPENGATTQQAGNREQIDRLKGHIEDYLQRKGLNTRKPFRCLNPAHEDKHPSMSFYRKGQRCHCFSCGANYDIFDLAGIDAGLNTFPEQLKYIAEFYGETLEPYKPAPDPEEKANEDPDPLEGINIAEYLSGQYAADLEKFKQGADIKTGFPDLDQNLGGGLYSGLYVIGATPGLGKTTFMLQLADQIAETRRPVLFFSLEQSRLELVTKSISRTARKMNPGNQTDLKTSLQIRKQYANNETMDAAFMAYKTRIAPDMNIIEGNFKTTIDTIRATISKYISETASRPAVIIDYLQIVKPGKKSKARDNRAAIDEVLTELKRASRDLDVPILTISTLNRMNYSKTMGLESFKESGGVEYTADVAIGLQYGIMATLDGKNENDAREKIAAEMDKTERDIMLICVKNRYGKGYFQLNYKYYPMFDYFIENTQRSTRIKQTINDIPTL